MSKAQKIVAIVIILGLCASVAFLISAIYKTPRLEKLIAISGKPYNLNNSSPVATSTPNPIQSGKIDEHLTIDNTLRDVNFCGNIYKVKQVFIDGVDVVQRIAELATKEAPAKSVLKLLNVPEQNWKFFSFAGTTHGEIKNKTRDQLKGETDRKRSMLMNYDAVYPGMFQPIFAQLKTFTSGVQKDINQNKYSSVRRDIDSHLHPEKGTDLLLIMKEGAIYHNNTKLLELIEKFYSEVSAQIKKQVLEEIRKLVMVQIREDMYKLGIYCGTETERHNN